MTEMQYPSVTQSSQITSLITRPISLVKLGSYFYTVRFPSSSSNYLYVYRCATIDGTWTAARTISLAAGYESFVSQATLKVIGSRLYLLYTMRDTTGGTEDTNVYFDYSDDGTTWNNHCTVNHAGTNVYYAGDIFLLGASVFFQYTDESGNLYFRKYDNSVNDSEAAGFGWNWTRGSVVDDIFYCIKSDGSDMYLVSYDGADITNTAMSFNLTVPSVNVYYHYYYCTEYGAQIILGSQYFYVYDKRSQEWIDYNAGSAKYNVPVYSDWNTWSYIAAYDMIYKVFPAGLVVEYLETPDTEPVCCGWDQYILVWNLELMADDEVWAYTIGTTSIVISNFKMLFDERNCSCTFTEATLSWSLEQWVELYDDSDVLVFQGFVRDYSRISKTVKLVSPIEDDLKDQIEESYSGLTTEEQIIQVLTNNAMFLHAYDIDDSPVDVYTRAPKHTLSKEIDTIKRLETYVAYWDISGQVFFNDGTESLGKTYTMGDGKLVDINIHDKPYKIAKISLLGKNCRFDKNYYVNGQLLRDIFPSATAAELETLADNIASKNSTTVISIEAEIYNDGVLQWGETIECGFTKYSLANGTTFYIKGIEYDASRKMCKVRADDALIYSEESVGVKVYEVAAALTEPKADRDGDTFTNVQSIAFADGGTITEDTDLTIDTSGDIILDADDGDVIVKDGGVECFRFSVHTLVRTGDFTIDVSGDIILDADDGDIIFKDGGTETLRFNAGTVSRTGDITLDASGDIILDADGTDIYLKDAGTTFGYLHNSSGALAIYSSGGDMGLNTSSGAIHCGADIMYETAQVRPTSHKAHHCGKSTNSWDNVYGDDFINTGPIPPRNSAKTALQQMRDLVFKPHTTMRNGDGELELDFAEFPEEITSLARHKRQYRTSALAGALSTIDRIKALPAKLKTDKHKSIEDLGLNTLDDVERYFKSKHSAEECNEFLRLHWEKDPDQTTPNERGFSISNAIIWMINAQKGHIEETDALKQRVQDLEEIITILVEKLNKVK